MCYGFDSDTLKYSQLLLINTLYTYTYTFYTFLEMLFFLFTIYYFNFLKITYVSDLRPTP